MRSQSQGKRDIICITDFSSSDTCLASSSSDENEKISRKTKKGKDHKYRPSDVEGYLNMKPQFRRLDERRIKVGYLPPPNEKKTRSDATFDQNVTNDQCLTAEQVKNAINTYIIHRWEIICPTINLINVDILDCYSALAYRCEFYVEARKVKWATVAYHNDCGSRTMVDPVTAGKAPDPWTMDLEMKYFWIEYQEQIEIPHTSSVRKCWYCKGKGETHCRYCKGCRFLACRNCSGSGELCASESSKTCYSCLGCGEEKCFRCSGVGQYICKTCNGKKKLKWFLKNEVKRKIFRKEAVINNRSLQEYALQKSEGRLLHHSSDRFLSPVKELEESAHGLSEIAEKTFSELESQCKQFGRIISQRQTVIAIDITKVKWKLHNYHGYLYVIGKNKAIHFSDSPQEVPSVFFQLN